MADKLVVDGTRDGYAVFWYIEEDADIGAQLGQRGDDRRRDSLDRMIRTLRAKAEVTDDDRGELTHLAATVAVAEADGAEDGADGNGLVFRTEAKAKAAIALARALVKSAHLQVTSGRSWPEWALTATAAGWKPPRGWTP